VGLQDIDTIVIAIMENRSFDHMLGYLSLPGADGPARLEGLKADPNWRSSIANRLGDNSYEPRKLSADADISDPAHDQQSIAKQIGVAPVGPGPTSMGGFVESYVTYSDPKPTDPGAVMGYYDQAIVPTFDFFARHYCVCDHWFAALPLGTQANRLMAMAGESKLIDNAGLFLPDEPLVYDWLTRNQVSWCVYQAGNFLPFFSLMVKWLPEIASSLTLSDLGIRGRFRRYARFKKEWQSNETMPSVIFVEPEYSDGPHKNPSDDHPPTPVGPGQALLADLYRALISNPKRWAKTLLVITYDEHGGFFDHVPPLAIETVIAGTQFKTTGVRVPAFLVSPHVEAGTVFSGPLDHTSLLQLLDDRFGGPHGYSVAVNARQPYLDRISRALTRRPGPNDVPPPLPASVAPAAPPPTRREPGPPEAPGTPNAIALDLAARKLAKDHPDLLSQGGWQDVREYLATTAPKKA